MEKRLEIPSDEVVAKLDTRFNAEPPPSTRTEAERDRDRVLYCSALLRLGHITQVAAPEAGQIFHSRLTHTIKVAQVARGLAQRQKKLSERKELDRAAQTLVESLDESATEAAALAHDLGHPPFGHLAEKVLQARSEKATFEGNPQSFRIVTRLALQSADGRGLNLTRRTLNGILKYPWLRAEEPPLRAKKWGAYGDGDSQVFDSVRTGHPEGKRTLEAWLMNWADDITYAIHDMDDFYRAGLIPLERLTSKDSEELEVFKDHLRKRTADLATEDDGSESRRAPDPERFAKAAERLFISSGDLSSFRRPFSGSVEQRVNLRQIGSSLIGSYIDALVLRDGENGTVILEIDDDTLDEVKVLKQLTWFYVINRPSLSVIQRGQTQIIDTLYTMYQTAIEKGDVHLFPPVFAKRLEAVTDDIGRERVVIDLISSMTESSVIEVYKQRIGVSNGSLLTRVAGPS